MKNKILFSLTLTLGLLTVSNVGATCKGEGWSMFATPTTLALHGAACCPIGVCKAPPPPAGPGVWPLPPCVDVNTMVTTWFDPGLIAGTAVDLLANKEQDKRIIDAQSALDKLKQSLGSGCSGKGADGQDTALDGQDSVTITPDEITDVLNMEVKEKADLFDDVRYAAEKYLFYTKQFSDTGCEKNSKPEDCVLQRQSTWLLTSVVMAMSVGNKVLAVTKSADGKDPLYAEFEALAGNFNQQKSPMGMWGGSSGITLHTHVQQNDINALYARDLEMNALNGVRGSDDVQLIQ